MIEDQDEASIQASNSSEDEPTIQTYTSSLLNKYKSIKVQDEVLMMVDDLEES